MAKTVIVYWSGTGNTEAMAQAIANGIAQVESDVAVYQVNEADPATILAADKILLGCPSMGVEELEEYEFRPFFDSIKDNLFGKSVALFGSYDWGDGLWMRNWEEELNDLGADLFSESFTHMLSIEGDEALAEEFGKKFVQS